MPLTTGFNHVATLTTDMDLTVGFYEEVFGAVVIAEIEPADDHPWMKILDLGGGAALNVFEAPAETIIGEGRRQGGRGAIDHFALAVDSRADAGRRPGTARRIGRAGGGRDPAARPGVVAVLS